MLRFSDADLEAVRAAVQAAEGRTSGEIVPFISAKSDSYEVASWRAGALFFLVTLAAMLAWGSFATSWDAGWLFQPATVAAISLGMGLAGAGVARFVPWFTRLFAGRRLLQETVQRRALAAFVSEEVFDTRDRTGILLFVSLAEHRVEVIGDAGINERVAPDDWADVVLDIRSGIRRGEPVQGMVKAIERCGELLQRRGVEIKPDDDNELPDGLRIDA